MLCLCAKEISIAIARIYFDVFRGSAWTIWIVVSRIPQHISQKRDHLYPTDPSGSVFGTTRTPNSSAHNFQPVKIARSRCASVWVTSGGLSFSCIYSIKTRFDHRGDKLPKWYRRDRPSEKPTAGNHTGVFIFTPLVLFTFPSPRIGKCCLLLLRQCCEEMQQPTGLIASSSLVNWSLL